MHHLIRRTIELSIKAAALAAFAGACQSNTQTETETHFLTICDSDCPAGLSCVCGVCTEECTSDSACAKFPGGAECLDTASSCGGDVASACDVECTSSDGCRALGSSFTCVDGHCRGTTGSAADSGAGGASMGGQSGAGVGGTPEGGASQGGAGGTLEGGASQGGAGGTGSGCSGVGAPCCDPFPGDGPNYCNGGLLCGANNTCEVDCDCPLGAYRPVCGVDGTTYDATCGNECVPVDIACNGECPCQCLVELATGCWSPEPGGGTPCCDGLQCCNGVPYDPAGQCRPSCDFVSDREAKTDVVPADKHALLETVAQLPMNTWRYRVEPGVQHIGPMAQDFASSFGFGKDERVISAVEARGGARAAV
jgi:hypothetical protein